MLVMVAVVTAAGSGNSSRASGFACPRSNFPGIWIRPSETEIKSSSHTGRGFDRIIQDNPRLAVPIQQPRRPSDLLKQSEIELFSFHGNLFLLDFQPEPLRNECLAFQIQITLRELNFALPLSASCPIDSRLVYRSSTYKTSSICASFSNRTGPCLNPDSAAVYHPQW